MSSKEVGERCEWEVGDPENWFEYIEGWDKEKYCRDKCLEIASERGDGCCEAIRIQGPNNTFNDTECLYRPKVGLTSDEFLSTRAVVCEGKQQYFYCDNM